MHVPEMANGPTNADSRLTPEEMFLAAIFKVWKADVTGSDAQLREQALSWVRSDACEWLCEVAGLNPDVLRRFAETTELAEKDMRFRSTRKTQPKVR